MTLALIENPRFLDRLNAVCTVLLATALTLLVLLAVQPSMNPSGYNGGLRIALKAPAGAITPTAP